MISYQDKRDLFANYYVGPQPSGTAAQMYVSPQPVPANVGHTYTTYQPLMPHEYPQYKHHSHATMPTRLVLAGHAPRFVTVRTV